LFTVGVCVLILKDYLILKLPVVIVVHDFFGCRIWNQVPDGNLLADHSPYLGGGNGQQRRLNDLEYGPMRLGNIETGPLIHKYFVVGEQGLVVFPFVNVGKAVASHNDGKSVVRIFLF
jgi:hypothetical protein